MMRSIATLLFAALACAGCFSNAATSSELDASVSPDGASGPSNLPCDVDAVLARSCRECHSSPVSFGAPMPLVTWADLHAPARSDASKKVYELVGQRIHDDAHPMPQPPNARLSTIDTSTIDAWIASGAPSATCNTTADASTQDAAPALSCSPDTRVAPASAFTMPDGVDELYVCYGFEATAAQKRHIIAMAPRVDDAAILHHLTLMEADSPVSPTPAACPLSGSTTWRPVFGWAPGGKAFELPKEAGFALDATTHFVVQMHYANYTHLKGAKDASGFDLCTTDKLRANDADIMAFGTTGIVLPPHKATALDCNIQVPWYGQTTHLFASFPHMHKLGTSISSVAHPAAGGAPVDLGSQAHWAFGEQGWIPIDYTLVPNDIVETNCAWNNTTDGTVSYGEKTSDEMCFDFMMYYPKITAAQWSWAAPVVYAQCK